MRAALVLCVLASAAHAQPDQPAPTPDAKPEDGKSLTKLDTSKIEALFDQGTKHYDLGEWDAAIASFKQAYALLPDPSFLYNLGQAYRQKGSCREATAAYKAYLRNAPDDDRAKVEQFVHELESCVKVEDEKARQLLPPPALSPRSRRLQRIGLVTTGAGIAILGGAGFFAYRSKAAEHDLERCDPGTCTGGEALAIDERGRHAELSSIVLGATGVAVLATGLSIYFYSKRHAEYVVAPTPGGAMFGARAAF